MFLFLTYVFPNLIWAYTHFRPPKSSMEGEMSSACLYQKYCDSDDLSHSGTICSRMVVLSDATSGVSSGIVGQ